jgi:hypothetical protein
MFAVGDIVHARGTEHAPSYSSPDIDHWILEHEFGD